MLTPEEKEALGSLMRKVVAMRRRTRGACPICGREWEGYTTKTYCSRRCANLAWYRRHRDEALARRRQRRNSQ